MKSHRRPSTLLIAAALVFVVITIPAHAQSRPFELASHFTFFNVGERAPGFGATFTYNAAPRFGLESTLNFFPGDAQTNLGQRFRPVIGSEKVGKILQGQFGPKLVVLRFKNAQFFAKAKPGLVSFSNLRYVGSTGPNGFGNGDIWWLAGRQTSFALDIGGGVEFSPTQTTFLRFDLGDTYFHYNSFKTTLNIGDLTGVGILPVVGFRGSSVHTLQVSTGIGLRFGGTR